MDRKVYFFGRFHFVALPFFAIPKVIIHYKEHREHEEVCRKNANRPSLRVLKSPDGGAASSKAKDPGGGAASPKAKDPNPKFRMES